MSALPRTAAALLIASLALLGGAAAASAQSFVPAGAHQASDDFAGFEVEGGDINSVHHETNAAVFGDMVLD
ncbi:MULTISPECIES: hypothetical protein [Streptomyces]|uniref:Uncharacterized protein n=1 Tax=Streptomyces drozdowiczii TaxID=202862 RepID=A0ABY6Q0I2_9ACTN|nr:MULTISPECIES: hypothetical protein [Streptomyces]MCX0241962.1 hypothetical protein [Streptomyces drozdowiczii]UZK57928.1 hypothetical protein NEH16_30990 [Streptomyces drozdowiczii]